MKCLPVIFTVWLAASSPLWALDQKDRFLEFEIEVRSDVAQIAGKAYPFKIVKWPYPYQKLAHHYAISLHCKYSNQTKADLYEEAMSRITNGFSDRTVYDCRRRATKLVVV
jgi:hypothetical protein